MGRKYTLLKEGENPLKTPLEPERSNILPLVLLAGIVLLGIGLAMLVLLGVI